MSDREGGALLFGGKVNEVIVLRFEDFRADRARAMLECARHFAASKPDGVPGKTHGTAYPQDGGWVVWCEWTAKRSIVARERVGRARDARVAE